VPHLRAKACPAATKTGIATAREITNFFMIYLKKLRINKIYRRSKIYL
jgi:hypothetical protein